MKAGTFRDHHKGTLVTSSSATFGTEIFELDERQKINIQAGTGWTKEADTSSESDKGFMSNAPQPFTAPTKVKISQPIIKSHFKPTRPKVLLLTKQ
jgi:hypothetical protein